MVHRPGIGTDDERRDSSAAGMCLYCASQLDGSEEHLLLSAIGGRKSSRKVLCSGCNNRLGSSVDKVLADQLMLFSSMLAIKTGRGKEPPTLRGFKLSTGERLDLLPGSVPRSEDVTVTRQKLDGRERLRIRVPAHRKDLIARILSGILAKSSRSLADLHDTQASLETRFVDERVEVPCELGGKECFRAVGKMALNLLAARIGVDAVRGEEFNAARKFVSDDSATDEGLVNHDYRNKFPEISASQTTAGWCHVVAVSANAETGVVAGFVELYGGFRFTALLSDTWRGRDVTLAYRVDPVAGIDEEVGGFPPSSVTRAELLEHSLDESGIRGALDRLSPLASKRMEALFRERIIEESFAEVLSGVDQGEEWTDEQIMRLSRLIADRFMQARHRQSRSTPLDLADLLATDPEAK